MTFHRELKIIFYSIRASLLTHRAIVWFLAFSPVGLFNFFGESHANLQNAIFLNFLCHSVL